jgi:ribosome recycling factor
MKLPNESAVHQALRQAREGHELTLRSALTNLSEAEDKVRRSKEQIESAKKAIKEIDEELERSS